MSEKTRHDVTELLDAAGRGDQKAADELLPVVYTELRALAHAKMAKIPPGQTFQPTALVHEAYVRLVGKRESGWENRGHFFHAAARAMRDILVEHARQKASLKRGGDRKRVDAFQLDVAVDAPADSMLALDEALQRLERDDPRKYQLVMLRFFAGLTAEEAAKVLGVSVRTVERDWRFIRGRLHKELADFAGPDEVSDGG